LKSAVHSICRGRFIYKGVITNNVSEIITGLFENTLKHHSEQRNPRPPEFEDMASWQNT
jgi:hypothetical protein